MTCRKPFAAGPLGVVSTPGCALVALDVLPGPLPYRLVLGLDVCERQSRPLVALDIGLPGSL